jgi:hypothetical protein
MDAAVIPAMDLMSVSPIFLLKGAKRVRLANCMLAPTQSLYARAALASVRWRTVQPNFPS